jgi:hypothetical protein
MQSSHCGNQDPLLPQQVCLSTANLLVGYKNRFLAARFLVGGLAQLETNQVVTNHFKHRSPGIHQSQPNFGMLSLANRCILLGNGLV